MAAWGVREDFPLALLHECKVHSICKKNQLLLTILMFTLVIIKTRALGILYWSGFQKSAWEFLLLRPTKTQTIGNTWKTKFPFLPNAERWDAFYTSIWNHAFWNYVLRVVLLYCCLAKQKLRHACYRFHQQPETGHSTSSTCVALNWKH